MLRERCIPFSLASGASLLLLAASALRSVLARAASTPSAVGLRLLAASASRSASDCGFTILSPKGAQF